MGYSTNFDGELRFTNELAASQLATLKAMCGEDCREHPEWDAKVGAGDTAVQGDMLLPANA